MSLKHKLSTGEGSPGEKTCLLPGITIASSQGWALNHYFPQWISCEGGETCKEREIFV